MLNIKSMDKLRCEISSTELFSFSVKLIYLAPLKSFAFNHVLSCVEKVVFELPFHSSLLLMYVVLKATLGVEKSMLNLYTQLKKAIDNIHLVDHT